MESPTKVAEAAMNSIQDNPHYQQDFRTPSPNCCIFKVPELLSSSNEGSYKPKMFSIGPLHHSDDHLKGTQSIKFHYLKRLVARVNGADLNNLTTTVAELEPEAREYYSEQQIKNLSKEKFVEILVLDGCFIIEILRKMTSSLVNKESNDPVFDSILLPCLCMDMMLLENQIPWMILDRLFTITNNNTDCSSLLRLAINFCRKTLSGIILDSGEKLALSLESVNCRHILDLARRVLITTTYGFQEAAVVENDQYQERESIPTATELISLGVKLKKSKSRGLAICFKDGVLEMSPLLIYDGTETLLRNIIALEQCCSKYSTLISSYASFVSELIRTTQDINCLRRKDIVALRTGTVDALELFSKLDKNVWIRESYHHDIAAVLNAYCRRRSSKRCTCFPFN